MSIGEQIKKARQNKGYTQQELADMLGVTKNTVTGYERGNRAPDALKIKAICLRICAGIYAVFMGETFSQKVLTSI